MARKQKKRGIEEAEAKKEAERKSHSRFWKLPNESIIQYLSRIIKLIRWWSIITFLIGLPGVTWTGIQLYNYFNKDELSESKVMIMQEISVLENELSPMSLPIEIDTLPDVMMIKQFRKETLDACTYWKRFESQSPYHDFITEDVDRLSIYQTTADNSELLWLTMFRSLCTLGGIVRYAYDNEIDIYDAFDNNKSLNLHILAFEHDSIRKKYLEQAEKYRTKDREKTLEIINSMKNSPDFYAFPIEYFKNIKEFHDICNLAIRNYLYDNTFKMKINNEN